MDAGPPVDRVYRCRECGTLTQVGGGDFLSLANPFVLVSETVCLGCRRAVSIRQVEWADTGECVAAYRKRLLAATPAGSRLFFRAFGPVVGAAAGAVLGFASGLLLIGPVGNPPGRLQVQGLVGGGVGAYTGATLGGQLLTASLMRWIWKLDYRGEP